jgi:universal stress protein A
LFENTSNALPHNTMTYKNIIVAVDNDEMDETLCSRATRLAELFGSKVKLVHVIEPLAPLMASSAGGINPVAIDSRQHTNAKQAVSLSLSKLAASMGGPDVTTAVVESIDVRAAIQDQAIEFSAELIIVGSWGKTGLALMFGGATASNMLKDSPCDVLAVSIN